MTEHRREQLWKVRDQVARMHSHLRWNQLGVVGQLVVKWRTRLEKLVGRIDRRLAS
jgi:hypothetical protein